MARERQKPEPELSLISDVIYADGHIGRRPPEMRRKIMQELGFPPGKIHVETEGEDGTIENLRDVQGTLAVYDRLAKRNPNSLTLVTFPGSLEGGWQALVREVYRHTLGNLNYEGAHAAARSVEDILLAIRDELYNTQGTDTAGKITRVAESVRYAADIAIIPDIRSLVRKHVLLAMFSGSSQLRAEAKVACNLGIMDVSCSAEFVEKYPDAVAREIKSRLRSRGL